MCSVGVVVVTGAVIEPVIIPAAVRNCAGVADGFMSNVVEPLLNVSGPVVVPVTVPLVL